MPLIESLFSHLMGHYVGNAPIIAGLLYALSFWFLHHAIRTRIVQPIACAILCLIGLGLLIFTVAAFPAPRPLLLGLIVGILCYSAHLLAVQATRKQAKKRRPDSKSGRPGAAERT